MSDPLAADAALLLCKGEIGEKSVVYRPGLYVCGYADLLSQARLIVPLTKGGQPPRKREPDRAKHQEKAQGVARAVGNSGSDDYITRRLTRISN